MITSKTIAYGILKAIGILVLIGLLLLFLYEIQSVIIYVIVSIIVTMMASPMVDFFKRKLKFSNTLAVSVTLLFFGLLLVGLFLLFVPLILSQGENLSLLDTNSIQLKVNELLEQATNYAKNHNIDTEKYISTVSERINFDFFSDFFNSIISSISNFGIGVASVLFITFFFLKEKLQFILAVKRVLPDNNETKIINSLQKIKTLLTRYFIGLVIQLTIICVLYFIVLIIFDVQNAFVIAFLCAILNIIPYVGPLIGSVLAGILTMLSNIGGDFQTQILPTTLYVMIGFFVVQLIDNNLSSPIIFSKSVKSHPLEIFLVILISGILFGIIGMIIAVPMFTILKVIGKEFLPENKIIKQLTKNI